MTGWNLPPGVNVNDLPGNRPEDMADEGFWDALFQHPDVPSDHLPEEWWDDEGIVKLVRIARDLAYTKGYDEGRADSEMAWGLRECDHKWRYWNELGKVICRDCGTDAPPEVATPIMAGEIDRLRRRGR